MGNTNSKFPLPYMLTLKRFWETSSRFGGRGASSDRNRQSMKSSMGSTKKYINHHVLSGFCTYSTCAYREVKDP